MKKSQTKVIGATLIIVGFILFFSAVALFYSFLYLSEDEANIFGFLICSPIAVISIWGGLCVIRRRFKDFGTALIVLAGIASLFFFAIIYPEFFLDFRYFDIEHILFPSIFSIIIVILIGSGVFILKGVKKKAKKQE